MGARRVDVRRLALDRLLRQHGEHPQLVRAEPRPLLVHHFAVEVSAEAHEKARLLHDRRRLGTVVPVDPARHRLARHVQPRRSQAQPAGIVRHGVRRPHLLQGSVRFFKSFFDLLQSCRRSTNK